MKAETTLGRELPFTGEYTCSATSYKDLDCPEVSAYTDVQDEINYQFHKGSNDKLIVFFHGNGEGDFPVKDTNNNIAQILANRGGAAWVTEAQDVFGDASVMCFQAPNMWYFAIKDNLLEPCYNEIQKVIEENGINPDEIYLSGASAGGFMCTRMIIAYPDLFKAAMINCPALDAANARSESDDAIPTDEELAQLLNSDTAIWLVQGETDSSVDPEECSKRIWNIITKDAEVTETHFDGDKGIASGFTTYETADNKYKLSLYETVDLAEVTGISGETRQGGKLKFAEDYDQDGLTDAEESIYGTNPMLGDSDLDGLISYIKWIHDTFGITIWMIEHQMQVVNTLADNVKVINFGKELAEGTPEQIQKNPAVIEAYLGNADISIKDAYSGLPSKRAKEV